MKETIGTTPHPVDGDLVRYLDRELAEIPERRLRAHLRECDRCAGRVATMAAEARTVARYLAAAEVAGPDEVTRARALATARRARAARESDRRRALRTFAAAAVIMVLVLSAGPVRAWISDGWTVLRGAPAAPAEVTTLPASVVSRSSVVAFTPRGVAFDLQIERRQPGGSLTLEVRDVERASAQVLNGSQETILVLPSGLRVQNAPGSRASYLVTIPADMALVRVAIGGEIVATLDAPAASAPATHTFPLSEDGAP